MSTHPTILGEMVKQQTPDDADKTSLDVEHDLALPTPETRDEATPPTGEQPTGERRHPLQSE